MSDQMTNRTLKTWKLQEAMAEAIVPLAGKLYREQALVICVFGTSLVQKTPIQIISIANAAGRYVGQDLSLSEMVSLLKRMRAMSLGRARIDVGKLLIQFGKSDYADVEVWAQHALKPLIDAPRALPDQPQDVVLYGFGRIGRLIARILVNKTGGGDKYRLRAIVLRPSAKSDLQRRASLLARDSVHGPFHGTVTVDEENSAIIANGAMIKVLYANNPDELDYTAHNIHNAVVIDNTGIWRTREALGLHLKAKGAAKVILTAPGDDIPNIVFGVNNQDIREEETLFSAASCTTNCIVPVLKTLHDEYGIVRGHLETIHAFTNDQNLIDNFHKKDRRGRAAPLNMVITSTGAAKAASKALPSLEGKLTGSAIRVPTPNVSLAILNLDLEKEVDRDSLNEHLRMAAMNGPLHAQIDYSVSPELVSSDLVGNHHAGIVDSVATIARDKSCVLYVWYDNEFGYSCQVVRLMQEIAGVTPLAFP